MLASQRRQAIAVEVARTGAARVADLTDRFAVSDMTIRRDLEELEAQGRLKRVHGGAMRVESSAVEPGFEAKRLIAMGAKRAIAERAAALVAPRSAIGISAGTTTWALAERLRHHAGPLSVVTNSTSVADALATRPATAFGDGSAAGAAENDVAAVGAGDDLGSAGAVDDGDGPGHAVILTGGLRTPSAALVGAIAERALGALHVDQLFLGVHGMDLKAGLTTPNLAEAQTNAVFAAHAKSLIVLADSSKWATVGLATIAPLTAVDVLITDDGLPKDARAALADAVGELIVVAAQA